MTSAPPWPDALAGSESSLTADARLRETYRAALETVVTLLADLEGIEAVDAAREVAEDVLAESRQFASRAP